MRTTFETPKIFGRGRRFALALAFVGGFAHAQTELVNRDMIRKELRLEQYDAAAANLANVKIAILDNDFAGFSAARGVLPYTAQRIEAPNAAKTQDPHGTEMAEIVWGVTNRLQDGPQFYLINTNGYGNLKWAIDYVIANKIDIVLYSQTWAFGGQFDGQGFINAQVSRATNAGVLWINAAGNDGQMIYNGNVEVDDSTGYVKLPGPGNVLRLTNNVDENPVTITLAWSDFTNDENYKTTKDLDVLVYDSKGVLVASGDKIQKGEDPNLKDTTDKRTAHAREEVMVMLDRGEYQIRVERKSLNFSSNDKIRVTVHAPQIGTFELKDRSEDGEINIPADNPSVVTVGFCDKTSAIGTTTDGRVKPDIALMYSLTAFSNRRTSQGTSDAAAIMAGVAALMKAAHPGLTADGFKRYIQQLHANPVQGMCLQTPFWRTPAPADLPRY